MRKVNLRYPNTQSCLALRAARIHRFFNGIYDNALSGHGFSAAQLSVLMAARDRENATSADIIQMLHLDRSTISQHVANLKARELLETQDHMDRRYKLVMLTDTGLKALHAAYPSWELAQKRLADLFGDDLRSLAPISNHIVGYSSPIVERSRIRPRNYYRWEE